MRRHRWTEIIRYDVNKSNLIGGCVRAWSCTQLVYMCVSKSDATYSQGSSDLSLLGARLRRVVDLYNILTHLGMRESAVDQSFVALIQREEVSLLREVRPEHKVSFQWLVTYNNDAMY
ncbi:hypothetical protein Tco_1304597 [Tanacetum coccineum]